MQTKQQLFSFVVAVLFFLTVNHAHAQSPVKFGIGIEGGIPTGSASDAYSVLAGINLNVRAPLPVTGLEIIGSAGYQQWSVKKSAKEELASIGLVANNYGILPIKVGARYGIGSSPFYIKFDLGPAITVKEVLEGAKSGTSMSYSPGLGTKLGPFDVELKYDIFSKSGESASFFGLKLAYYFN